MRRKGLRFPNGIPRQSMSDKAPLSNIDLRDRIAAVQHAHYPIDYAGGIDCTCGTECQPDHGGIDVAEEMWAVHVADAVIAALNLRTDQVGTLTRYVTNWIAR